MQNILLVVEAQSYLIISMKERLESLGYHVIVESANMDAISKIKEPISAVMIYMDEELSEKNQIFIYLKDRAVEEEMPLFVIGDADELRIINKAIPADLIAKEFERPINVNEVTDAVDSYVKNYGKENRKKILVVDDSGAMLRNVKGWLGEKYHVILANSGAMAIKYLALNQPDLVLLDYEMPVVDGKQVLEMIRTESEFAKIPVIFLTGKDDRQSVLDVMALKPEGYLLKTMAPEQIIKYVDDFFEKRKAHMNKG